MSESRMEEIYTRLIRASGDAGWEKNLASLHMDGRHDWTFRAAGQPGIKAVVTCNGWDAEFIERAKDDILWLLNRVNALEIELVAAEDELSELRPLVAGDFNYGGAV